MKSESNTLPSLEAMGGNFPGVGRDDSSPAKRRLDALLKFTKSREAASSQTCWRFPQPRSTANRTSAVDGLEIDRLTVSDRNARDPPSFPKSSSRRESLINSPAQPSGYDVSAVYARAASSLLEGMDVDGISFLNPPRENSRTSSRRSSCISNSILNDSSESIQSHQRSWSQSSREEWYDRPCEVLASAFSSSYRDHSQGEDAAFTQCLVRDLFISFPEGEILNSMAPANFGAGLDQDIADGLGKSIPLAKSVLFLPMWDWDKSRWLAGILIWTKQHEFSRDDLYYVRAFSDAILSELAQLDRKSTAKSQQDLLSSVSHELRTPLHGMLANSELLQSSPLDPAQQDMVKLVKTCGETLLETMNHLLVFAKVNNFTTHRLSGETVAKINGLETTFELDSLLEDITETLYAGRRSQTSSRDSSRTDNGQETAQGEFSVALRFEGRDSWKLKGIPGAWRRIIMDILGNALKFTPTGFIDISLSQAPGQNSSRSRYAHIRITDTGCGISPDYLRNKLFTPFTQEHILTDGVGLGLSIAHRLVSELGGHIDINSGLGIGTQVDICIPVEFVDEGVSQPKPVHVQKAFPSKILCLVGLNLPACVDQQPEPSFPMSERIGAITKAVASALHDQNWSISHAETLANANDDVAVIEKATLERFGTSRQLRTACRSILVLGGHNSNCSNDMEFDRTVNVVHVSQPLIPRKIRQALEDLATLKTTVPSNRPCFLSLPDNPNHESRSSVALAAAQGLTSPPAVRDSVSEYISIPTEPSQYDLHVMIVDDNEINLRLLSGFMDKIGCTYDTASNGHEAIEKYKASQTRFDYVLMDISMPVMDGITAARTIRDYEDESTLTPAKIMAVTAVASNEMQQNAVDAGMDEYLVKPLSLSELKRIMGLT